MPDTQHNIGGKLQSFRVVMEALIAAALIWTGSSLLQLKTQLAVVQTQLTSVQATLVDVPSLKLQQVRTDTEVAQLRVEMNQKSAAIDELRKLRSFR